MPGQILPPFVRDSLELTEEQIAQLDELQRNVDARLAEILTEQQRQQLRQPPGPGGPGGPDGQGGPVVVVPADLADSDLQVAVPAAQVDRAVDLDNLGKVDRSKVSLNALRWSLLSSLR